VGGEDVDGQLPVESAAHPVQALPGLFAVCSVISRVRSAFSISMA
jgi:hypothetical protein